MLDLAGGFESADTGHQEIHDYHVGSVLADEGESRFAVLSLPDENEGGVPTQDEGDQYTDVRVVIHDQDSQSQGAVQQHLSCHDQIS
jgi:hypothetical protein